MSDLAGRIRETAVEPGSIAVFWLGQAGFVYKTAGGKIVYVDPYLSDYVHRKLSNLMYGFQRIMPSPIAPEQVETDYIVCTHAHEDHFDVDTIAVLLKNPAIHFVTAPDCRAEFEKLGAPTERYTIIGKGESVDLGELRVTGVYADHGELAPDAMGVLLEFGDIQVWQVGDTAYRPAQWQNLFERHVDILIPPINGAFGNLDGVEAAQLARDAQARVAIPCHFWMFAEHGGNPAQFLDSCKELAPTTTPLLMTQGQMFVYRKSG